MRLCTLLAVTLVAGCATPSLEPARVPQKPAVLYLSLPDDIYHFRVPVDTLHDTSSCEPAARLIENLVPSNYEFTFYPCIGPPFNARMAGTDGVKATAEAAGKKFMVYRGVRDLDGTLYGKVVLVYTPRTATNRNAPLQ